MKKRIIKEFWLFIKKYTFLIVIWFVFYGMYINKLTGLDKNHIFESLFICFNGFNQINNKIFGWLYIHLPIWIIIFVYFKNNMEKTFLLCVIKMKSMKKAMIELLGKVLLFCMFYYSIAFICIKLVIILWGNSSIIVKFNIENISSNEIVLFILNVLFSLGFVLALFIAYVLSLNPYLSFVIVLIAHVIINLLSSILGKISIVLWSVQANLIVVKECGEKVSLIMALVYVVILYMVFITIVDKRRERLV